MAADTPLPVQYADVARLNRALNQSSIRSVTLSVTQSTQSIQNIMKAFLSQPGALMYNTDTQQMSMVTTLLMSKYHHGTVENGNRLLFYMNTKLECSHYILCVGYRNGDIQIGVSGKAKYHQKLREAVGEEILEELGMLVNTYSMNRWYTSLTYGIYQIPVRTLVKSCSEFVSNPERDTTNRVSIMITGTLNQMATILPNMRSLDEPDINQYVAIPVPHARRIFTQVMEYNNNADTDTQGWKVPFEYTM